MVDIAEEQNRQDDMPETAEAEELPVGDDLISEELSEMPETISEVISEAESVVADDELERELAARRARAKAPETEEAREKRIRTITENFDSNVDYTTVLDNFEGPLDLLLFLISKDEIEIQDIFVSQVTEQFLDYMKGLPYIDVDKVTEYLNIAATILKIKSQSLVPALDEMQDWDDYDDIEDDKAQLIQALEEYRLIKEETEKLKKMETIGYYFKAPDKNISSTRTVFSLDGLTLDGLVKAFSTLLLKRENTFEEEEVREIPRDEFTVAQKILFILEAFETAQELRFEELFTKDFTRNEIITTFQALLELLKHQYLHIRQPEPLGQIYITFNPEASHQWIGQQIDEYE